MGSWQLNGEPSAIDALLCLPRFPEALRPLRLLTSYFRRLGRTIVRWRATRESPPLVQFRDPLKISDVRSEFYWNFLTISYSGRVT